MEIRDARATDASQLAHLINLAGEGIPEYLWRAMIEGSESPLEVGARRAARSEGSFSYTNARVCIERDAMLGMLLAYRQPDPFEVGRIADYPEVVRPLVQLEARAPGSWYINAVATFEQYRGRGVASRLIADTELRAAAGSCDRVSLIVASENVGATRLYEHLGYEVTDSLPVATYPGCLHGGNWVLMVKRLAARKTSA
jgi:ribosomal protein S18 acetylase RimI-like enzyme